jgi:nucleotide-binding universal stress UspA family protein
MSDAEPEILRDAERTTDKRDEIVVGLNMSPAAKAALRWAAEYARAVGVSLRAVTILDWPTVMTSEDTPLMEAIGYRPNPQLIADYQQQVRDLFDAVQPEQDWTLQFEMGRPGRVLVHQSESARLLVIGTGEHVGLGRILVGSTSHHCLSHAFCPVVGVPTRSFEDFPQG